MRARMASRSDALGAGGGFGPDQQGFAVALRRLDVVHDAVAAGEAVLELGRHRRQAVVVGDDGVEEGGGRREDKFVAVEARIGEDPLDHRLRRAAAMVADAVEAHGVAEARSIRARA